MSVCNHFGIPLDKPFKDLSEKVRKILFYGSGGERIHMRWEAPLSHGQRRIPA
jgi:excinuclease ABC subunit A